jgi:hypothetical protein
VFDAVRVFLSQIASKGTMTDEILMTYLRGIANARFLFDEELNNYLIKLRNNGIDIQMFHTQLQDVPIGAERTNYAKLKADRLIWLVGQFDTLESRFTPYLQFEQRNSRSSSQAAFWKRWLRY